MAKLRITLLRSIIGRLPAQRATVEALGLRKIGHTVEHQDTPQVRGMIEVVKHMVKVEEI